MGRGTGAEFIRTLSVGDIVTMDQVIETPEGERIIDIHCTERHSLVAGSGGAVVPAQTADTCNAFGIHRELVAGAAALVGFAIHGTPRGWTSPCQGHLAGKCAEVSARLVEGDSFISGGSFRLEVTSEGTAGGAVRQQRMSVGDDFAKRFGARQGVILEVVVDEHACGVETKVPVSPVAYSWESSDVAVATVDAEGVVTPVADGTCTMTGRDGTSEVSLTIKVESSGVCCCRGRCYPFCSPG